MFAVTQPQLVLPSDKYKRSFIEAVSEFHADAYPLNAGGMGRYSDIRIEDLQTRFGSYLRHLQDLAAGRNLPPDWVPQSTYWLATADDFIGRVSIRHRLNETLRRIGGHIGYDVRPSMRRKGYGTLSLRLALEQARAMGLKRILITCDSINRPSRTIIERNGGVFESELSYDPGKPPKQRFWIDLAQARKKNAAADRGV